MNKKVGDIVWMDSYTSMGQNALGHYNESKIEKIEHRFDEKTGTKFPIYKVGSDWYDGRCGRCYSNDKSMYYIDLDYTPPTKERKKQIRKEIEEERKRNKGRKLITYDPVDFKPVYEDELIAKRNKVSIIKNKELIQKHIDKDGCFMIDYEHRKKAFKVFTVATQMFYVNSLDELTPERFMLEEERQKEYEKDSAELSRLYYEEQEKQNEND
jgi:hypothetical protein